MNKLAIDVGGTSIKWAVISPKNEILKHGNVLTNIELSGEEMIKTALFTLTKDLINEFEINGIAISTAGVVDTNAGIVVETASTMPKYQGTKLKEIFEREFNIKTSVENDSNCNGLCELEQLKGLYNNLLVVTIGTGVGGCVILNKQVYRGSNFRAGEIGQITIGGKLVDNLFSTRALVTYVNEHGYNFANGIEVFAAIEDNVKISVIVNEFINSFVEFIKNIDNILDFDAIVIGGGISKSTYFMNNLKKYGTHQNLNFIDSKFGNDSNLFGAVIHFNNQNKK